MELEEAQKSTSPERGKKCLKCRSNQTLVRVSVPIFASKHVSCPVFSSLLRKKETCSIKLINKQTK